MKPVLFIDTNIMLDLLGERTPFYNSIAKIATLADEQKITIVASALSYATVSYFLTKYEGVEKAKDKLRKFKVISKIYQAEPPDRFPVYCHTGSDSINALRRILYRLVRIFICGFFRHA